MLTTDRWIRGADLGPDEWRALGAATLAILRRIDAARQGDTTGAEDDGLLDLLIDTPLVHVLQEAVELLAGQMRTERRLGRADAPRRAPSVDLAWLADSLTYTDGRDSDEQEERARFALLLDPAGVDALTQLGWHAEQRGDHTTARARYEQAIAIAAGRLDPARLRGDHKDDDFWLDVAQRPYMRARGALAGLLWKEGRPAEAVAIYRELVRLSPSDGPGNRYCLAAALLEAADDAGARRVLDRLCRGDGTAHALWPRALATFALEGDGPAARRALAAARRANPHLPAYVLDSHPVPWQPTSYSPGSVEEAISCATMLKAAWARVPDARSWLERAAGTPWTERQETEAVLARLSLRAEHRLMTHYRAVRALAELADRRAGDDGDLLRAAPGAVIARFWRTLVGTERGCWLWAGSTTMRHRGLQARLEPGLLAHAIARGRAIPATTLLHGSCGTRDCVNPTHHHNIEVLTPDGIAAELEARFAGARTREACRDLVTRALKRAGLGDGLRDLAIQQPPTGGPLVRRELVDRWLERQVPHDE